MEKITKEELIRELNKVNDEVLEEIDGGYYITGDEDIKKAGCKRKCAGAESFSDCVAACEQKKNT